MEMKIAKTTRELFNFINEFKLKKDNIVSILKTDSDYVMFYEK